MKTKNLLKKAFLLLALIGGASSAWGDTTIGLTQTVTDEGDTHTVGDPTYTGTTNLTVTKSIGSSCNDGQTGKTVKVGSPEVTYTVSKAFRKTVRGTVFVDAQYVGYTMTVASGYKVSLTNLNAEVWSSDATMYWRVVVIDNATSSTIYTSSNFQNNSNNKGTITVASPSGLTKLSAGTYTVKLQMYQNGGNKYFVVPSLTFDASVEESVTPPGAISFMPAAGSVAEGTSITLASSGASTIEYQWGTAAIGSEGDWSGAQTYSPEEKPVVPDYGSANNVLSVKASNANGDTYGSATYAIKKTASLARVSAASVTLDPELTSQIVWSTSSTGDVTFESGDESVATVDKDGLITAVAFGTATITVRQAADAEYYAGSFTVSVTVNKARKATEVTGEFILDTANGTQSSGSYTSSDGSVILEGGIDSGSNTYNDLKNSHFKHSSDITFTLPTNYPVSSVWFVGYGNGSNTPTITLKKVDGSDVTLQNGSMGSSEEIPTADCVGFELETPAEESMVINVSKQSRGYFILNPAAKNIAMTQVGANYYATFYSAGEVTITGATAYTAAFDEENSKLVLTECTGGVVGGRTGVILIGNSASATATPSFTGASKSVGDLIGVAEKAVAMANYYAGSTSAANKVFVLGNDEGNVGLYKYTGTNLGVNKAYLYTDAFVGGSARSITFTFGDNITSINGVNAENVKAELKKFFENGKLVIEKDGKRFNAAGAQVK